MCEGHSSMTSHLKVEAASTANRAAAAAAAVSLQPKEGTKGGRRLRRCGGGAALQEEILEWDVVEFAAYGKERVGLVLKVDVPSSACVVQPLVREESGLWLENADVAATEVNLTTVRVCLVCP